jgi:hypothetical protein
MIQIHLIFGINNNFYFFILIFKIILLEFKTNLFSSERFPFFQFPTKVTASALLIRPKLTKLNESNVPTKVVPSLKKNNYFKEKNFNKLPEKVRVSNS